MGLLQSLSPCFSYFIQQPSPAPSFLCISKKNSVTWLGLQHTFPLLYVCHWAIYFEVRDFLVSVLQSILRLSFDLFCLAQFLRYSACFLIHPLSCRSVFTFLLAFVFLLLNAAKTGRGRASLGCCLCPLTVLPQIFCAEIGSFQTLVLSVISGVATDTVYHCQWWKDDELLLPASLFPMFFLNSSSGMLEERIDIYRWFLWRWMRSWRFLPDACLVHIVFPHFKSVFGDAMSSFIA